MKNFLIPLLLIGANLCCTPSYSVTKDEAYYINKADKLHKKIFTIDTHNDAAMRIINPFGRYPAGSKGQVTVELMKEGGLDAAIFAIFISQGKRDDSSSFKAVKFVDDQLTKLKLYALNHPGASVAYNSRDLRANKKRGKTSIVLGIENGYAIGKDLMNIKKFRDSGVVAMTICHSYNNDICDSSSDTTGSEYGGLSVFGEKVIKKMNEVGMIIDVSHASKESVMDVLKITNKPIIASHSGAYSVHKHARNLSDEEIRAIAANGGLVQVVSLKNYLSGKPKDQVTVKDMADHIDYIKNLVGIEHVGVGTDFDGGGGVIGMEDASKMKSLTVELLKRGYSKRDLKLFWGENFIRVLNANKKSK